MKGCFFFVDDIHEWDPKHLPDIQENNWTKFDPREPELLIKTIQIYVIFSKSFVKKRKHECSFNQKLELFDIATMQVITVY